MADNTIEEIERLIGGIRDPQQAARIVDLMMERLVVPFHESATWGDRLMTLDKSIGWREDPKFSTALAALTTSTGQTQYRDPDGIAWRLNTLVWAARNALQVEGDFVECGVFEGQMSWFVNQTTEIKNSGKTFYLYDTFDGFSPKYSSAETDTPDRPGVFQLHDEIYRDPRLFPAVEALFSNDPHVKVVKGIVPDILDEISPDKIAYLHLDMNSPRPERAALETLWDRISPGGVIVLDDYGWRIFAAQKDAADEFFGQRRHEVLELPTGQGLVVKQP